MKRRAKNPWKWVLLPALTLVLIVAFAGVALAAGAGGGSWRAQDGAGGGTATGSALLPLTEAEETQLLFLLEEEKLARDVYESLYAKWGAAEFSKIAASEQRHMNSVLRLVEKYGLDAPSTLDTRGEFDDGDLQNLYKALIEKGGASLEAAYQVGVDIEVLDIEDSRGLDRLAGASRPSVAWPAICCARRRSIWTAFSGLRAGLTHAATARERRT